MEYLREALEARRKSGLARHPWAAINYNDIASNLIRQGRFAEAEAALDEAPEFEPNRGEGMDPGRYGRALIWTRACLQLATEHPKKALELLEPSAPGPREQDEEWARFRPLLAEALCAVGRRARGLELLTKQIAADSAGAYYPHDPRLARLRAEAGLCALEQHRRTEAVEWAGLARWAFVAQPEISDYYKSPSLRLDAALAVHAASAAKP